MIEVRNKTIVLHDQIAVDGFPDSKDPEDTTRNINARLQSHFHDDHLNRFFSSFGQVKKIFMTQHTKELIRMAQSDFSKSEMLNRRQVNIVEYDKPHEGGLGDGPDSFKMSFINNSHVLGSSQILIEKEGADSILFSSDIGPGICDNKNPNADILILDPTCGHPDGQIHEEEELLRILKNNLLELSGPIIIQGHTGTIEKVIPTLDELNKSIYLSDRLSRVYKYYESVRYPTIDNLEKLPKDGIKEFKPGDTFFYLRYKTEGARNPELPFYHPEEIKTINLSAFHDRATEPWEDWLGEGVINFYFTAHANFNTTLDYISSVAPKMLYIDNTRANNQERCRNLMDSLRKALKMKKIGTSIDILGA